MGTQLRVPTINIGIFLNKRDLFHKLLDEEGKDVQKNS